MRVHLAIPVTSTIFHDIPLEITPYLDATSKVNSLKPLRTRYHRHELRLTFPFTFLSNCVAHAAPFHCVLYSKPNPLACVMAFRSLSFSFPLLEYSGSRRTLKHVCAVGSLQGKHENYNEFIAVQCNPSQSGLPQYNEFILCTRLTLRARQFRATWLFISESCSREREYSYRLVKQ